MERKECVGGSEGDAGAVGRVAQRQDRRWTMLVPRQTFQGHARAYWEIPGWSSIKAHLPKGQWVCNALECSDVDFTCVEEKMQME